jgi:multidrug efflux pump subunit AcrB
MDFLPGEFLQQDTGILLGTIQVSPESSFQEMSRPSRALDEVVGHDPDVATVATYIPADGLAQNQGRTFITLKPRSERVASASQIMNRLKPQLAQVPGAVLYLQSLQDINVGGRLASTQFQFTLWVNGAIPGRSGYPSPATIQGTTCQTAWCSRIFNGLVRSVRGHTNSHYF